MKGQLQFAKGYLVLQPLFVLTALAQRISFILPPANQDLYHFLGQNQDILQNNQSRAANSRTILAAMLSKNIFIKQFYQKIIRYLT